MSLMATWPAVFSTPEAIAVDLALLASRKVWKAIASTTAPIVHATSISISVKPSRDPALVGNGDGDFMVAVVGGDEVAGAVLAEALHPHQVVAVGQRGPGGVLQVPGGVDGVGIPGVRDGVDARRR